ncbi:uncharacterized protein LOC114246914 [Bombyx mandarina]|uniref:Uncharacterized protein LOC114246914 n=1 Tax=Bombyx mandarina TaxID=7092 RepID=A0A6J2JZR7_BOMMA|nr:uncharacterized protein LOC114246914 [Bombyx mandarina]
MDEFFKKLKNTVTYDNIVGLIKNERNSTFSKEEESRVITENNETKKIVDFGELTSKFKGDSSKHVLRNLKSQSSKSVNKAKGGVLLKSSDQNMNLTDDNDPYVKNDNILAFLD